MAHAFPGHWLVDFAESANYRSSPLFSDTRRLVRYCILPGLVQYRHLVTAFFSVTNQSQPVV